MVASLLRNINELVWGVPLILLLMGTSLYFSWKLKFLQVTHLGLAWKYLLRAQDNSASGDVSPFGSICTALSATLGVGNIIGVALAISMGGPGALFWMWVATFFGMAVKYAEGVLSIRYRQTGSDGKICGGPMYYIEFGLKSKWLARFFAFFGIGVALVGIGTWTQTNSIAVAMAKSFAIPISATAAIAGCLVAIITIGGIRRIASVSEKVVPLMTIFYIGAAILVLIFKAPALPRAFASIFMGAFSPQAVLGGSTGVSVMAVMQRGISRGIFAHESGLGSAAIASAAARTNSPSQQGLVAMVGAFLSIIVCTMTALVLLVTQRETGIFSRMMDETLLTSQAFGIGLGVPALGEYVVNLGIIFFAFTTVLGWNYYGEKCVQYLFGTRAILAYKILFLFFVVIGPFWKLDLIFTVADIATGLMAIPNLIGLIGLRKVIFQETHLFQRG
ncbi:MAG: amino acid carrier protein [Puniceicoccales bacterium]|jgi:AGCS family alanine or glycine:cation symporter|nr:amino acid carrier protein [Puniceicoccales bacterium]